MTNSSYTPPSKELYTFPGERTSLIVSILIMVAILFGVFAVSMGLAAVGVVLFLAYIRIRQGQLLGNSVLVTPTNFPQIYNAVTVACERLGERRPRVHIVQDPYLNAFAIGFSNPFSIVLHSALVKSLEEKEILFVIGHELGHIKSRHTLWLSVISYLGKPIPGFDLIFGVWMRKAEYTCDRAGLIVCQDLDAAIRALVKISSGVGTIDEEKVKEFLKQAREIEDSQVDRLGEFLGTHPYATNRVKELIAFSRSSLWSTITGIGTVQGKMWRGICPECKYVVIEDWNFCEKCGAPLHGEASSTPFLQKQLCKVCGSEIKDGWKFCFNCGSPQRVS